MIQYLADRGDEDVAQDFWRAEFGQEPGGRETLLGLPHYANPIARGVSLLAIAVAKAHVGWRVSPST
jgi:hypothetical protein